MRFLGFSVALFLLVSNAEALGGVKKTPRTQLLRCARVLKSFSDDQLQKMGPKLVGLLLSRGASGNSTSFMDGEVSIVARVPGSFSENNAHVVALSLDSEWELEGARAGLLSAVQVRGSFSNVQKLLKKESILFAEVVESDTGLNTFASVEDELLYALLTLDLKDQIEVKFIGTKEQFLDAQLESEKKTFEFSPTVETAAPGVWSWRMTGAVGDFRLFFAVKPRATIALRVERFRTQR